MKTKLLFLIAFLAFGAVLTSCKDDPPPAKTDEELQLEKLARTWIVEPGSEKVKVQDNDVSTEWASFELTFTDGAFTSSGASSTDVWPASGNWSFATGDVNTLMRTDGTDISINVTETALLMTFNYTAPGGRVDGIEGNWEFNMVAK